MRKKHLNSYLAGLLEGDGSFIVPKSIRDKKKRLRYAKIKVAFHIKDKPLAELLKSYFGGNFETHENYLVWNITDIENLILISNTINGYLRTPKINDFHNLIDYLNQKRNDLAIIKHELDDSPIDSNAWLAGFSDANSNFNIILTERKNNKFRIQIQYRLEIKHYYNNKKEISFLANNSVSFYSICEKISNYLNGGFYYRSKPTFRYGIIVTSHNLNSHAKLIKYFDKFPLFSSKFLDYSDWKSIYELQCQKRHLTHSGIQYCKEIKMNFNNTRSKFSWAHLEKFYSLI